MMKIRSRLSPFVRRYAPPPRKISVTLYPSEKSASKTSTQKVVLVLTIVYFIVELLGGLYYGSLALVTDASFMAINITGQSIAFYVNRLVLRIPDKNRTFGYERAKVLSGLFNGTFVGFLLFYVFIDAYHKILHPEPIEAGKVLYIALAGLCVDTFVIWRLYRHAGNDLNIKGILLLVLNDALGSLGVVTSSLIIGATQLYFVDPLTGVVISLLAVFPTWKLIRESVNILMEGNPAHCEIDQVKDFLESRFGDIRTVKDLHIWGLSPEHVIMAARIRTRGKIYQRQDIQEMKHRLKEHFRFSDVYLELYEDSGE